MFCLHICMWTTGYKKSLDPCHQSLWNRMGVSHHVDAGDWIQVLCKGKGFNRWAFCLRQGLLTRLALRSLCRHESCPPEFWDDECASSHLVLWSAGDEPRALCSLDEHVLPRDCISSPKRHFFFWDRVSCSPGWTQIHYEAKDEHELWIPLPFC